MKLLTAKVENFGSYKELSFDFQSLGLCLIYGDTGSGKSTLQDIPTWIIFGQTAKNGNADDVRSWGSDQPTKGELDIEIRESRIKIIRIRGKSGQNDLYWDESGQIYRGKDVSETQKLLNERLGVDLYTYTVAAYYNEFSPAGQFFTAKASDRRELLESLADLSLPSILIERIGNAKKEIRKTLTETLEGYNKTVGRLEQVTKSKVSIERDAQGWSQKQVSVIEELEVRSKNFDKEKESKIEIAKLKADTFEAQRLKTIEKYTADLDKKLKKFTIDRQCPSCGALKTKDENELLEINDEYEFLIKKEKESTNPYLLEQENISKQENPYVERLEAELVKSNPYSGQLTKVEKELVTLQLQEKTLKNQVDATKRRSDSLDHLRKISDSLREILCKNALSRLESETNRYLETYFDSEIRVQFELSGGDKLEVFIRKSGHECSYRQLSKGQRSLLKLAFSVSAMKLAADKSGIHFDCLMFDESLDGLSSGLKIKAFNLFSELQLSSSSVLVIDHEEALQRLFNTKYYVTMKEDISIINEA